MNKKELVDAVAESTGATKAHAGDAVDAVFGAISSSLAGGNKVQVVGFGTFEVRHRAAGTARNPRTGEAVNVLARNAPAFKAGKALKDAVN